MTDALSRFVAHPLAVIAHVLGEALCLAIHRHVSIPPVISD
jgi:hypothetical protein